MDAVGVRPVAVHQRRWDDGRTLQRAPLGPEVETQFGAIDVKVARGNNGNVNAMPEFDQCRAAARAANVPLREVQEAARQAYLSQFQPK